jgi:hypothetical protein
MWKAIPFGPSVSVSGGMHSEGIPRLVFSMGGSVRRTTNDAY